MNMSQNNPKTIKNNPKTIKNNFKIIKNNPRTFKNNSPNGGDPTILQLFEGYGFVFYCFFVKKLRKITSVLFF